MPGTRLLYSADDPTGRALRKEWTERTIGTGRGRVKEKAQGEPSPLEYYNRSVLTATDPLLYLY